MTSRMKSWYLLPAFALGALAGWLGRGGQPAGIAASQSASKSIAERPASLRTDGDPGSSSAPAFPAETSPRKRPDALQAWIAGLNAGNWRSYLEQAVSPEAMDRQFLVSGSAESLLFLRKLGEIAPRETLEFLEGRRLDSCNPDVVEGWAQVAPVEAFQWSLNSDPRSAYQSIGRAAALMLAEDPAVVLGNPDFRIQREVALGLYRQLGIEKVSQLLETRWDATTDNEDVLGFRDHEFDNWSLVATYAISRSIPEDPARREAMIAWYQAIASRPGLNPRIRTNAELQIKNLRTPRTSN